MKPSNRRKAKEKADREDIEVNRRVLRPRQIEASELTTKILRLCQEFEKEETHVKKIHTKAAQDAWLKSLQEPKKEPHVKGGIHTKAEVDALDKQWYESSTEEDEEASASETYEEAAASVRYADVGRSKKSWPTDGRYSSSSSATTSSTDPWETTSSDEDAEIISSDGDAEMTSIDEDLESISSDDREPVRGYFREELRAEKEDRELFSKILNGYNVHRAMNLTAWSGPLPGEEEKKKMPLKAEDWTFRRYYPGEDRSVDELWAGILRQWRKDTGLRSEAFVSDQYPSEDID